MRGSTIINRRMPMANLMVPLVRLFLLMDIFYQTYPLSPIYLTRGGNIDAPTGSMRYANFDGYYWSAVAYQVELYAYRLGFGSVSTLPSANGSRLYGLAVRNTLSFQIRSIFYKLSCIIKPFQRLS